MALISYKSQDFVLDDTANYSFSKNGETIEKEIPIKIDSADATFISKVLPKYENKEVPKKIENKFIDILFKEYRKEIEKDLDGWHLDNFILEVACAVVGFMGMQRTQNADSAVSQFQTIKNTKK